MIIRFKKSCIWSDVSPSMPQRSFVKGRTYQDVSQYMAKRILEVGDGEQVAEQKDVKVEIGQQNIETATVTDYETTSERLIDKIKKKKQRKKKE